MKRKPIDLTVYSVRHLWKGIFEAEWSDVLNYPRCFHTLYRRVNGQWCSGEEHPTGVYNSGLIRQAPQQIADALDNAEIAHLNSQAES